MRLPCRRRTDEDMAVCMRPLGKRVRLLRLTAELTQQELSDAAPGGRPGGSVAGKAARR